MMKKFLVLLMLLGTASMASAGLRISIDGNQQASEYTIDVVPSGEVSMEIWTDTTILPSGPEEGAYAIVCSPLVGTISGGVNVSDEPSVYPNEFSSGEGHDGVFWFITLATAANLPQNSTIINDLLFHCEGQGDVLVELLYDAAYPIYGVSSVVDSVVIHQIPEPITMGLLGIGGLFLRRRK